MVIINTVINTLEALLLLLVKVMLIGVKTLIRLTNSAAPPYSPTILHLNHQYSELHEKVISAPIYFADITFQDSSKMIKHVGPTDAVKLKRSILPKTC